MDLNSFCRPCEIQRWFRRFENPQTPQESLSATHVTNLTELHFTECYPHLAQFFFLEFSRGLGWHFLVPEAGFCTCYPHRRICLHMVFMLLLCDICLHVSLPEWEVSGSGEEEEQQAKAFCFWVEELRSSKWLHFCFSEEKDKQGQSIKRKEVVVSRRTSCKMSVCACVYAYIYIYIHTLPSYS